MTLIREEIRTVELKPGGSLKVDNPSNSIVLVRPGEVDAVLSQGSMNRTANMAAFLFSPALAIGVLDAHIDGLRDMRDPVAANLLRAVVQLDESSDPLLVDHLTMAIIHRVRGLRPITQVKNQGRIERSLSYIKERLDQKLTLSELAASAIMSQFHFVRTFKEVTGMSPLAYVTRERLSRAKSMLTGPAMPIAQIAIACGFCSQSHFGNAFFRDTGMSPSEYRKAHTR